MIKVAITAFALFLLAPWLFNHLPPAEALLAVCCLGATDSGAIEDLLVAVDHPIRGDQIIATATLDDVIAGASSVEWDE